MLTDGAAESSDKDFLTFDRVSIGGVIIDSADGTIKHFGCMVPDRIVDEWRSAGILQVITQAEVYPVLMAKHLARGSIKGRRVISFIDNDAARFSIINSNSSSDSAADMLMINCVLDTELDLSCWYERVASESNLGDLPSRLSFKELKEMGSVSIEVDHPTSVSE